MKSIFKRSHKDLQAGQGWYLPYPLFRPISFFLKLLFSGVRLESDQAAVVHRLPPDARVVFVNKHKSHLERLFFYAGPNDKKIPCPEIGIGYGSFFLQPVKSLKGVLMRIRGFWEKEPGLSDSFGDPAFRNAINNNRAALFSLIPSGKLQNPESAGRDPLAFFIELQKQSHRPICLVPFLFFYGHHPLSGGAATIKRPTGIDPKPGILLRLFYLVAAPEKVFIEFSEPVDLSRWLHRHLSSDNERATLVLRRRLLDRITRHRQSITGPILKPVEEIRQQVLSTDRLRSFMGRYAKRRGRTLFQVQQEAVKYVDEIAARPSPLTIHLGARVVNWVLGYLFEGITVNSEGLKRMKQASRKGPVVIMPCHKSNFDSMVVSHMLYRNGLPPPHVFAGKNLAFFPMGPIFRKFGAFFVRRSFKGAFFYSKVFSEYIFMLLEQGFNIKVFIEGTRSRNGKLLLPKLGMLSIILNAVKNGAVESLHFVPVVIGYDRVPEHKSYIHELDGGQKEPESFAGMIKARKLFRKRFGRIYLKFCDPVSLKEMTGRYGPAVGTLSPKQLNRLCRDVGDRVMVQLDENAVVTPQALASSAILNCRGRMISRRRIGRVFETYRTYLLKRNTDMVAVLISDPEQALDSVLHYYVRVKYLQAVKRKGAGADPSPRYRVIPSKRSEMEYYKNNCVTFFVPAAFTAASILRQDAFLFSLPDLHADYRFLEDLFSFEFNQSPEAVFDLRLWQVIQDFEANGIVTAHPTLPDTFSLNSSKGFREIKRFAAFLLPFLESYWIVVKGIDAADPGGFRQKERLKSIRSLGHRMYKKGGIQRKEAISNAYFENALAIFKRKGLLRPGAGEKITRSADMIGGYLKLLSP